MLKAKQSLVICSYFYIFIKNYIYLYAVIFTSTSSCNYFVFFSMQRRKLGYHSVIFISIFIAEFDAGSQFIVIYMDWFSNTWINSPRTCCNTSAGPLKSWTLRFNSVHSVDLYMQYFNDLFFSAAFKAYFPYHCKRHFHIHTQTNTHTHSYPFSSLYTFSFLEPLFSSL